MERVKSETGNLVARRMPKCSKNYFCAMKFCTWMLITLWKGEAVEGLTPQNSTRWYGLHNCGAIRGNRSAYAEENRNRVTQDTEVLAEKHKAFEWKQFKAEKFCSGW